MSKAARGATLPHTPTSTNQKENKASLPVEKWAEGLSRPLTEKGTQR
jgi:hypothetical protein